MHDLKRDWNWSDRFIPEIKRIVGPRLLEPAKLEVDRNQATDLVTLRAREIQIACRVRRPAFGNAYTRQFTIRSHRNSGAKTEFDKIVEGWGDWMLYGFAAVNSESALSNWSLIDLHSFRAHLIKNPDAIRKGERANSDGTSFRWFDLDSFPSVPRICIASSTENSFK
jgi:hypothetical protein